METSSGGPRADGRLPMGYSMLPAEDLYYQRPSSSRGLAPCSGRSPLKRPATDLYQDDRHLSHDSHVDNVDDSYPPPPLKGSPPANGKKTKGRVKIKMEYIDNKLRRYTTFSKRKTGIMKKAYELSTLTGTQVMLLVASETGHVYTFATRKLQPMITSETGKALIQTCLNSPEPSCGGGQAQPLAAGAGDQRMSATGFEETDLSYNVADHEDHKEGGRCSSPASDAGASEAGSTSSGPSPPATPTPASSASLLDLHYEERRMTRSPPPSHLPPAPHSPLLNPRQSVGLTVGTGAPLVYASPSAALPNGGVIFSVPGQASHYITIPLLAPTDLSKSAPKPPTTSSS